jgi:hypothetical protein
MAVIGDDALETRNFQRIAGIGWFWVDVLHVKAAELKRVGVLQGLLERIRLNLRSEVK